MGRIEGAIEKAILWQDFYGYPIWIFIVIVLLLMVLIVLIFLLRKPRIKIDIGNAQFLGVAQVQNDYFASWENENGIFAIVSDGIGMNRYGRDCAEIVVKTYMEAFKEAKPIIDVPLFLKRLVRLANQRITKYVPGIDCGATLAAVLIQGDELHWISVGNSAIMIAGKEEIVRLNETYTELYFNEAAYKRKPLAYFDKYIGLEDDLKAQSGKLSLKKGQHVLLCTDGVYLQMSEQDMLKILKKERSAFERAQEILLKIENKQRTDQDNASLIVMDII